MTSVNNPNPCSTSPRLAALVLAAGFSSRMGEFKPLLPIGSSTAMETVVRLFLSAGIQDVYIALGHRAEELRPIAETAGAICVMNPNYAQGMYSSVCAGVAALPADVDACFVIPGDIPLVRASTIRQLARYYAHANKAIIYPVFLRRRGHPPLISRKVLLETLSGSHEKLSSLLAAHEDESCNLDVADEGIHRDMDTPTEFARMLDFASHHALPSIRECEAILEIQGVQASVVNHSRAVAEVAERIAVALMNRGATIDPHLARAGGLLHDIAKGRPDHAAVGAAMLRDVEFPCVADVVGSHTTYDFSQANLDEAAIVYLADKLVSGEDVIGIDQRFRYALERFRNEPVALDAAMRRLATAKAIEHEIEERLDTKLLRMLERPQ